MTNKPTDIVQFQGKSCSRVYARLLTMAVNDGVHIQLNSGFRSIAEQWKLYRLYKAGKGPLAAFPGTSTHNKKGYKQGLDIQSNNIRAFEAWAKKHGMDFELTVPGESWHLNARGDYTHHIYLMWHQRGH